MNNAVQEMIQEIISMLNDEMEYGMYEHPLNCVAKVPLNNFFKAIGELNALLTIIKYAENESRMDEYESRMGEQR